MDNETRYCGNCEFPLNLVPGGHDGEFWCENEECVEYHEPIDFYALELPEEAYMEYEGQDESYIDEDDSSDDYDLDDCGYIPGVGCTMAGTEYCDWDCPFMAEIMVEADEDDAEIEEES